MHVPILVEKSVKIIRIKVKEKSPTLLCCCAVRRVGGVGFKPQLTPFLCCYVLGFFYHTKWHILAFIWRWFELWVTRILREIG